jgi:hypothetical protein
MVAPKPDLWFRGSKDARTATNSHHLSLLVVGQSVRGMVARGKLMENSCTHLPQSSRRPGSSCGVKWRAHRWRSGSHPTWPGKKRFQASSILSYPATPHIAVRWAGRRHPAPLNSSKRRRPRLPQNYGHVHLKSTRWG